MGFLNMLKELTPSIPAAGFQDIFYDSADQARAKQIHDDGHIDILSPNARYNYLLNGGFDFIQRWSPALSTNNGAGVYAQTTTGRKQSFDQWGVTTQTASNQEGRIDTATAPATGITSRFYAQFKQITGAGKLIISQVIETKDVMPMRGRSVRLQGKLRFGTNASATNYRVGILQLTSAGAVDTIPAGFISAFGGVGTDPTWGANLSLLTPTLPEGSGTVPTVVNSALTVVPTNAFQRYSGVFSIPTNCLNLIVVVWTDSQLSINDDIHMAEFQLLVGQEVNDFFPLSYVDELIRVKRHCRKTFPIDTAPVQNGGLLGATRGMVAIAGAVATSSTMSIPFDVEMRVAPTTVTFYNPSAGNAFVRNIPAATDATVTATANLSSTSIDINATGLAGWTVGQELKVHALIDSAL